MWKMVFEHLKGHPSEYLLLLVVVFGAGWQASAAADYWVNQKIKAEVAAQSAPMQQKMGILQDDVNEIKEGLDSLLLQSLKREILEIRTLLCYTPGDQRLLRNFQDAQERHKEISGSYYEPPGCEILRRSK